MKPFDVYPIYDITPDYALGSYVYDSDGLAYLDMYGGHAVISIGHSHPEYVKRLNGQLGKIGFYSNSVHIPIQKQLCDKLGALCGYPDYDLFLCNSGAEANENALKLASFINKRSKIIAFERAFHGRTSLAVSTTHNPSIQAPVNQTNDVIFLPFNDIDALDQAFSDYGHQTCALIIEGIQGVGGVQIPDYDFLKQIEKRCAEYNVLFIADEVQSGYGRSGKFFAHQHAGVRPDLITIAKGMGNGFPVGGLLVGPHIAAIYGQLGTTFGGNHLACAASLAVLEVIEKENLMQNATLVGAYLLEQLSKTTGMHELRGQGLMIGIEFDKPIEPLRKDLLFNHQIMSGASGKNTIRLLPSLALSIQEADVFLKAWRFATANF